MSKIVEKITNLPTAAKQLLGAAFMAAVCGGISYASNNDMQEQYPSLSSKDAKELRADTAGVAAGYTFINALFILGFALQGSGPKKNGPQPK